METSEKVVLREQPEIKDLLQTLMKQGLKKEQRRSYPIVLTSIQILRMVYETRADASSRMSADQVSDVALSLEYVKQYGEAHKELNYRQACLLEQCVARRSYNLYSDVQRGEMLFSSFGPAIALANLGSTLQNTFASGSRVLDILEEEPLVEEIKDEKEVSFNGAKAENVTFAYKDEIILDNLSADIPKNSVVGIVGRSGSGKSTLLKLFMRFWKVENGSVKLSDTDIEHINTANLRNMESFVTQETHLFHDSIKNNIRIAKLNATDEEIKAACQKASVHEFIMTLPQGYDTQVGELGDTLSGGERQRIGLARAFLHDAPFMLLDEPTSNLDSLNEAVILRSLHEERNGKTVVLVSHRESTMRIADKIYSVEHGRMS